MMDPLKKLEELKQKSRESQASSRNLVSNNEALFRKFDFNGMPSTILFIEGKPCWIAKEIGKLLEYSEDGNRLTRKITQDWVHVFEEGVDHIKLEGERLRMLKSAGTESVPAKVTRLTVLTQSGLFKVFAKSDQKKALPILNWITRDVLPTIMNTGKYELPEEKKPKGDQLPDPKVMLAEIRMQREDRLLRQAQSKALLEAAKAVEGLVSEAAYATAKVEAAEIMNNRPLPYLRPYIARMRSPTQIAQEFGTSANMVGRMISKLGIRDDEDYSQPIMNTKPGTHEQVVSYLYNDAAVELIAQELRNRR